MLLLIAPFRVARSAVAGFGALLLVVGLNLSSAQTFQLVSDVWPPFTDVEGNNRVALELVETALREAGYDSETSIMEFAEVLAAVRDGEKDGSAAFWRDPAREQALMYSRAYLENRLVLVGRSGTDVSATRLTELEGKRIAYVGSYAYNVARSETEGPIWVEGVNLQDNLDKLLAGEVDYTVMDSLAVHHLQENYREAAEEKLAIGTTALVVRTLHFALRRDIPEVDYIIARFNEEIGRMMSNGTYHRILRLNWIRTDIDGDGMTELVYGGQGRGSREPVDGYALFETPTSNDVALDLEAANRRFYIEGKYYDSWAEVPPSFREPERDYTKEPKPGLMLLDLKL